MSLLKDKITLCKVPFTKEMNAHVENMGALLNGVFSTEVSFVLARAVRPSLAPTIRIPLEGRDAFSRELNYNYVAVYHRTSNGETETTIGIDYYFIDDYRWVANSTLELSLSYDSINSLVKSEDLSAILQPTTLIEREHEARWTSPSFTKTDGKTYFKAGRNVDRISEGFSQPRLFKNIDYSDKKVYDKSFSDTDEDTSWAVKYGRESDADPAFRMFVCPFKSGIKAQLNKNSPGSAPSPETLELADASRFNYFDALATKVIHYPYFPFADKIIIGDQATGAYEFYMDGFLLNYVTENDASKKVIFADPKADKPATAVRINYEYLVKNRAHYRTIATLSFPFANVSIHWSGDVNPLEMTRLSLEDSKVYHSDFFQYRLGYDVFAWTPRYEDFVFNGEGKAEKFDIDYMVSMNVSSVFAFRFSMKYTAEEEEDGDYPNILICRRNNELALVTDQYRNYLLNGFNYDQQAKAISVASQVTGGLVGAGVSLATGHSVGAVVAIATTAFGVINSLISSENSLEQRKNSVAQRAVTLAGNEEADIFRWATGDKLTEFVYEASGEVRRMLDDFFYYYGYRRGYQGIPDASGRAWFNYVQAVPKWKNDAPIKQRPLWDELSRKFQEGITFFHLHEPVWDYNDPELEHGYNFSRTKENWESNLIGGNN